VKSADSKKKKGLKEKEKGSSATVTKLKGERVPAQEGGTESLGDLFPRKKNNPHQKKRKKGKKCCALRKLAGGENRALALVTGKNEGGGVLLSPQEIP